jgi:hypothetical protein
LLRRLDLHANALIPRGRVEATPADVPPPTGISYLELVARGFFKENK